MKTLGIIGGLGPMATAQLLKRIVDMTDVKTDQEHLDVIAFSRPNVPDRTAYLLNHEGPSPAASLIQTARTLEQLGADFLAVPCITAHAFFDEIAAAVGIPLISMIEETTRCLQLHGIKKAGLMATSGTVKTGLFQTVLSRLDIETAVPDETNQQLIMELIYQNIKAGKPADMDKFRASSQSLFSRGCDSIILGCTELCVIQEQEAIGPGFVNALDVLAARSVQLCEKPVKPAYSMLIQPVSLREAFLPLA